MSLSLEDLGLAYRKAKVDLYYSSHASLRAIADYEEQLAVNLETLQGKINGENECWVREKCFLGEWILAPKSITPPQINKIENGLIFSSPTHAWQHKNEIINKTDNDTKAAAEFRLMAQPSLDFHVLSALWMLKIGNKYEKNLSKSAYGNRLRRGTNGNVNPLSLGSFQPYLKPFRDWRDKGIAAMRTSLQANKKVVALTADVTSFYHELNPEFMLDEQFNKLFKFELDKSEKKLHRLFIKALQAWGKGTPLKKGLPVGLPAAGVVANMALYELDRVIEEQVVPIYYGRYVDDIMLVMENGVGFQSTASLWEWLFERSEGILKWESKDKENIQYQPVYLKKSKILFGNSKNKAFILEGEHGLQLVDSITKQIHERASEWRALPNLPINPANIGTDLVTATQHDGEVADNLRKADALIMRRASFAIKLRDFEAYERDLPPASWQAHRHAFFRAFNHHVLVLPHFFELAQYLPRVVGLAAICEDFKSLREILENLEGLCDSVEEHCELQIKSCNSDSLPSSDEIMNAWRKALFSSVQESIVAAFPVRLSANGKILWQKHMDDYHPQCIDALLTWSLSISNFATEQRKLFSYDLAHRPFRFSLLPKELVGQRGIPPKKSILFFEEDKKYLPDSIIDGVDILQNWVKLKQTPHGLLFATRPINLTEIAFIVDDPYAQSKQSDIDKVVLALRGFNVNQDTPYRDKSNVLQIPHRRGKGQVAIAVSSWKTKHKSWIASIMRQTDPDLNRYSRLNKLVNELISQPKGAQYFILPELSLPAHWFLRLAYKLKGRGISLIAGVEYLHARRKSVHNQIWAAFTHEGLGFPSLMVYRQDKQRPALHEEQELQRLSALALKPENKWEAPPIIQHGEFCFSLLVCSELTNIAYRTALRGKVDALFVAEWNQDTQSFNALVESAALDIHAFIIQCNDRSFGDSRIRAPYKDMWKRDILRIKGGVNDYSVTGEIDVAALRRFQSSHRSSSQPFKPVPDGFVINHERKCLPEGE